MTTLPTKALTESTIFQQNQAALAAVVTAVAIQPKGFTTLAALKAAPNNLPGYTFNPVGDIDGSTPGGEYAYVPGNFTGLDDDVNIIMLNNTPLSTGALVRRATGAINFKHPTNTATTESLTTILNRIIYVEQFGAIGDGVANDQPAIQAAINYAATNHISEILFKSDHYTLNCPIRTTPYTNANGFNRTYDGIPMVVGPTQQVTFRSTHPRGTDLIIRTPTGATRTQSYWQSPPGDGLKWRGGAIMVRGQLTKPADTTSMSSLKMYDIRLVGSIPMGSSFFDVTSNGDGWDVSDKAVWIEQDTWTGDLVMERCSISGFRGELIYGGNYNYDAIWRLRGVRLSDTNGDLLNPSAAICDFDGVIGYNGNQAFEGWISHLSVIKNLHFYNCNGGGPISGGRPAVSGFYYAPTRLRSQDFSIDADTVPWGYVDIEYVSCGTVHIGSWIRGRIRTTDTSVILDTGTTFAAGLTDVDIEIIARNDKTGGAYLLLTAANDGMQLMKNNRIKINYGPTAAAIAANTLVGNPIVWYGNFGPENIIYDSIGIASGYPRAISSTSGCPLSFQHCNLRTTPGNFNTVMQNAQTSANLSVLNASPIIYLTATNAGTYPVIVPTANATDGSELLLATAAPNGTQFTLAQTGAGVRLRAAGRSLAAASSQYIKLKFNALFGLWEEVDYGGYV